MKTYEQRTRDIQYKIKKKKTQRKAAAAAITACCCIALAVILAPSGKTQAPVNNQPNISGIASNGYAPLLQALAEITEDNRYVSDFTDGAWETPEEDLNEPTMEPVPDSGATGTGSYEEVTDLQVQGVGEADLIKRTDSHIFYLRNGTLTVYSIAGEASAEVDSYTPVTPGNYGSSFQHEMYLSQDCNIITVISQFYGNGSFIRILSLDVSDPANIRLYREQQLTGVYCSSRMIGNTLYLFTDFSVQSINDAEDKAAYLPSYTADGKTIYPAIEQIVIPEEPAEARYAVITQLDGKTLEVKDTLALLSYDCDPYVSQTRIYLTRAYTDSSESGDNFYSKSMTEISQIRYDAEGLTHIASFSVSGGVQNQYSMDEKDGMLRVVTTIRECSYDRRVGNSGYPYYVRTDSHTNASLYCIDLNNHSIRASVESFAPEGETVRSVRFEGDNAYVCTAVVLTDPVFFFDLSDLNNITYKDTGTIEGFSTSLVDFQNGFLVGIGNADWDTLKIEIYREGETGVESCCSYEHESRYASDYEAYYIDRENQLIGLGMKSWQSYETDYVLLHFDGTSLYEVARIPLSGDLDNMRGVYIDGYLYVFGNEFLVAEIELL